MHGNNYYYVSGGYSIIITTLHEQSIYVCVRTPQLLVLVLLLLLRFYCAGQRLTPHYRTLEVRPGRIKLELKYDCERDDTNSLLGVLMFGWDFVIAIVYQLLEQAF